MTALAAPAFVQTPEAHRAFAAGYHAGCYERVAGARLLEISAGTGPAHATGALWTDLPDDARRTILYGLSPVPGLLVAKLLFGVAWPVASAVGILTAPLLIWGAFVAARQFE